MVSILTFFGLLCLAASSASEFRMCIVYEKGAAGGRESGPEHVVHFTNEELGGIDVGGGVKVKVALKMEEVDTKELSSNKSFVVGNWWKKWEENVAWGCQAAMIVCDQWMPFLDTAAYLEDKGIIAMLSSGMRWYKNPRTGNFWKMAWNGAISAFLYTRGFVFQAWQQGATTFCAPSDGWFHGELAKATYDFATGDLLKMTGKTFPFEPKFLYPGQSNPENSYAIFDEPFDTNVWDSILETCGPVDVMVYLSSHDVSSFLRYAMKKGHYFRAVYTAWTMFASHFTPTTGRAGDFTSVGTQWHSSMQTDCALFNSSARFTSSYQARYGAEPHYLTALMAFDATAVILGAMMKKSVDTKVVNEGIRELDNVDTFFGPVQWIKHNMAGRDAVTLMHLNGSLSTVGPIEYQNDRFAYPIPTKEAREGCPIGKYTSRHFLFGGKEFVSECQGCPRGKFSSTQGITAAGDCRDCSSGTFGGGVGLSECESCPIGKFSKLPGAEACESCPPGKFLDVKGQSECLDCPVGEYAGAAASAKCTACPATFVTLFRGATSKMDCLCGKGTYYSTEQSCSTCVEGSGLTCDGDKSYPADSPPVLQPGYMSLPYGEGRGRMLPAPAKRTDVIPSILPPARLSTYLCSSEAHCPGGGSPFTWEDVCFGGRTGIACAVCQDGYYINRKGGACEACSEGSAQSTYMAIMALPLICAYLYKKLNDGNGESEMAADDAAAQAEAAAAAPHVHPKEVREAFCNRHLLQHIVGMIVLFNEQVVSVVSDSVGLLLEFVQSAQVVTSLTSLPVQKIVMNFAGLDLQVLGVMLMFDINMLMDLLGIRLQCVTGHSFATRYMVELCIPLVIVFFFMTNFVALRIFLHPFQQKLKDKVRGKKGFSNKILKFIAYSDMKWDKVVNALGAQVSTLFIGLTSLSMSIYVTFAHPPDGGPVRYSLRRFPGVLADSDERQSMVGISIIALLVYTFGVVAGAMYVCWAAPVKAHKPAFMMRYFFLLDGFRPERWWWGTAILIKGLLLNLCLAVFPSPRTQNVCLVVIFMVSLALLFSFSPWPNTIHNVIDTIGHIACALLLATTSYFIIQPSDNGKDTILNIAVASMNAPVIVAICCMFVPMYQFTVRRSRAINKYRLGQRLRDLLLLVTRRSNNEMNTFLNSLDDSDLLAISKAMNVFYTRMYFMHPSKNFAGNRVILETDNYEIATDQKIIQKVEHDMVHERRTDGQSISERALMQWFVEMLVAADQHSQGKTGLEKTDGLSSITLGLLFDDLDEHKYGIIEKEEFVANAIRINPKMAKQEAEQVFDLMDLDGSGNINREEFDIIMSGMTFTGQALDGQTKEGKYLRKAPPNEELEDSRKTCSRLAVMFETENFAKDISHSAEQKRRERAQTEVLDEKRKELARTRSGISSKSLEVTSKQAEERKDAEETRELHTGDEATSTMACIASTNRPATASGSGEPSPMNEVFEEFSEEERQKIEHETELDDKFFLKPEMRDNPVVAQETYEKFGKMWHRL